jgi:hypothetical protein
MVAVTGSPAVARGGYFYVWMAAVFVIAAFGSFAGTYWLQVPVGTFVGPPIVHVHALVFSAWPLLFLGQAWRAAQGRLQHHRAWGVAGVSLATAMLILGLATAIDSLQRGVAGGHAEAARAFLIVPVTAAVLFAVLVAAAVMNVERPEWHKRLMLIATAGVLQAALARVFFLINTGGGPGLRPGLGRPPPVVITIGPGVVIDLLIFAGMVYDWRTRGRPHPAYYWAGGATLALQVLRIPLSTTPAWQACARFLEQFAAA